MKYYSMDFIWNIENFYLYIAEFFKNRKDNHNLYDHFLPFYSLFPRHISWSVSESQKSWKIRWNAVNARRESAEILSYCKGDRCSRRRFPVEFNSIEIDTAEDFSDPPKLQTNPNAPARTGKLSLDVNRVTRRNLRGNIIAKNTLSRWQTGQRYDIMSAEHYKHGYISQIIPPS